MNNGIPAEPPTCDRCGKPADGQRAGTWYCTRCAGVIRRHEKKEKVR